jgi:hypothetical protein
MRNILCGLCVAGCLLPVAAPEVQLIFEVQEIARDFGVGYAVSADDVNGDGKVDIVAINGTQAMWFENPSWRQQVLIDNQTPADNVAIAPRDIDGDGRLDLALAAAWNPRDTNAGGTLHWLQQRASPQPWGVFAIGSEPTLHRIRWANVDGAGPHELIVAPLHGRGTSPPEWNGPGARVLAFRVPRDPARETWEAEEIDSSLHILHNFAVIDFDNDRADDLITASREGVHLFTRSKNGSWTRTRIGEGAPGEIKAGRVGGRRMLATIEPWHGHSVVVYLEPERASVGAGPQPLWTRRTIEDQIAGGHALGWADFDGDGDDELAAGWREKSFGLAVYRVDREGVLLTKTVVDASGMAAEDLAIADFDSDRRPDIVASGRKTANVRIYWNRSPRKR